MKHEKLSTQRKKKLRVIGEIIRSEITPLAVGQAEDDSDVLYNGVTLAGGDTDEFYFDCYANMKILNTAVEQLALKKEDILDRKGTHEYRMRIYKKIKEYERVMDSWEKFISENPEFNQSDINNFWGMAERKRKIVSEESAIVGAAISSNPTHDFILEPIVIAGLSQKSYIRLIICSNLISKPIMSEREFNAAWRRVFRKGYISYRM